MKVSDELILEFSNILCNYRFIIVQHLLKDTYEFVETLLKCGVEISCLLFKEYSCDKNCYDYLKKKQLKLVGLNNYSNENICSNILSDAAELTKIDKKKIIILDLGGEFANIVSGYKEYIQCVVEDTHYGHWKYEEYLEDCLVYSVADSDLKELEAIFVGRAIVDSVNRSLLDVGITLAGKSVLLLGYGMIGKNVARTLKSIGARVKVYDILAFKGVQAVLDGHQWVEDLSLESKDCTVVIGVTGNTSIDKKTICDLASNTYLVSGSSKQIEIDISYLKENSDKQQIISECITMYSYEGKTIYILNDGKPINFLFKSIPDEIIDLVFSEMVMCVVESGELREKHANELMRSTEAAKEIISRKWLNNITKIQ